MPPNFYDNTILIRYNDKSCHIVLSMLKDFCYAYLDLIKMYAITVSLHPSEVKVLKDHGRDPFDYLRFKLDYLGYKGLIVSEYTKKKVEHIHGIVWKHGDIELKDILTKSGKYKYSIDDKISSSNCIKPLKCKQSISAWIKYIGKCYASPEIIDYMDKFLNPLP